jgi:hypothetical protein
MQDSDYILVGYWFSRNVYFRSNTIGSNLLIIAIFLSPNTSTFHQRPVFLADKKKKALAY